MGIVKYILIVVVLFTNTYVFANTDDEVYLLNTSVMNHHENALTNFLPESRTLNVFDRIRSYDVKDLNFEKNLSTFKELSHEIGICGGFTQVSKSDLSRIQNNIFAQQSLKNQEQHLRFRINSSIDIQNALSEINEDSFRNHINFLTSFKNRSARNSDNSEIEKIKNYIQKSLPETSLEYKVELVTHRRTPQKSIHIQVKGELDSRIVMGGHVDSINQSYFNTNAPGADDNASGSAALMQILNVILKQNKKPKYTFDFFWYAGEEIGLIGSGEIAKSYGQQNIPVIAVLQLDMLGVPDRSQEVYLEKDYSSTKLNAFISEVSAVYVPSLNVKYTSCGYPCSDHSSWYQERFPVVFPTSSDASNYNSRIHTDRDTADTINLNYSIQISRLSLAFLLAADQEL